MLKIGILGMGGMGWFHAQRYLQLPNAEIVAMADLVPERLEARESVQINIENQARPFDFSNVARYPDAETFIAEADVDVVDICLPTDLHAPYAIQAMEAGLHVLCEKPMALNPAEADAMIATSERTGRKLMIAQCLRFWPEYVFLHERIETGVYGRLLSLNMWRMGGMPRWSAGNWFADPARSGGMVLDLHIHDVDFVNAVLGMPDHVYATGREAEMAATQSVIHACFEYNNGPQIHMHAGWSAAQIPFQAGFEAWFDRGFVRYAEGKLQVYDNAEQVVEMVVDDVSGDGYLNEIAYFLKCVEDDSIPEVCLPSSTRDSIALIAQELALLR